MNGQDLFAGRLLFCADKFVIGNGSGLSAASLADPALLRTVITRFAAAHGAAPWQPACSMWSQWYFGTLLSPAVTLLLADEPPPALTLADVNVVLCPDRVVPLAFHAPPTAQTATGGRSLAPLFREHLPPIVEALRPAIAALLDDVGLPAPQQRVLARARAVALDQQPFRRRLCCLRDRMPGMVNCGDLCPQRTCAR